MLIFAFPGTGKTSLAQRYPQVIDLEVSDVKYDTRGLSRRAKEAAKALKRPLKRLDYRQAYREKALALHQAGRPVLVAMTFLPSLLWQLLLAGDWNFLLLMPQFGLRAAYRQRYLGRGNNARFVRQVMLIWWPALLALRTLGLFCLDRVRILSDGQTLTQLYEEGLLYQSRPA